ncbi:MAG: hypothetical protein P8188_09430 [Gemmatimonadota bacterium]|jgi:hypothetical protein
MRRLMLMLVLVVAACATIAPQTEALEGVHATYRQEFLDVGPPLPGEALAPEEDARFSATLQAIRDYRLRFGEDSPQAAHLTVLEGMIYLQTGRLGMAALVEDDVVAATGQLMSGEQFTRDALFAAAYPDLIEGWEHSLRAASPETSDAPPSATALSSSAEAIATLLRDQQGRLAAGDADQGAIYLATTAATFWAWSDVVERDPEALRDGRDLIGCFLSGTERKAATTERPSELAAPAGRIRYLDWYNDLQARAGGDWTDQWCPGAPAAP